MLAVMTRMTLTQVSTWFANARRRLKKEYRVRWLDDYDDDDDEDADADADDDVERDDDVTARTQMATDLRIRQNPSVHFTPPGILY